MIDSECRMQTQLGDRFRCLLGRTHLDDLWRKFLQSDRLMQAQEAQGQLPRNPAIYDSQFGVLGPDGQDAASTLGLFNP